MFTTQYILSISKPQTQPEQKQTKPKQQIKPLDTNGRIKSTTSGIYKVVTEKEKKIIDKIGDYKYKYMMKYKSTNNPKFLILNFPGKVIRFNQYFREPRSTQIVIFYIKQLLELIKHIHSQGVILRDINLQYIWLGDDGNIQLLDFRNATDEPFNDNPSEYLVPAMTEPKMYYNVDYFLLGVILYKMITVKDELTKNDIPKNTETKYLDLLLSNISTDEEIKTLLRVLLDFKLENVDKLTEIENCDIIKAETRTDPPYVFNKTTNKWQYNWVTENTSTEPRKIERETKQETSVWDEISKETAEGYSEKQVAMFSEIRQRKDTTSNNGIQLTKQDMDDQGYQDTHNIYVFPEPSKKKKE